MVSKMATVSEIAMIGKKAMVSECDGVMCCVVTKYMYTRLLM